MPPARIKETRTSPISWLHPRALVVVFRRQVGLARSALWKTAGFSGCGSFSILVGFGRISVVRADGQPCSGSLACCSAQRIFAQIPNRKNPAARADRARQTPWTPWTSWTRAIRVQAPSLWSIPSLWSFWSIAPKTLSPGGVAAREKVAETSNDTFSSPKSTQNPENHQTLQRIQRIQRVTIV